jgi:hypothetical protein
LFPFELPPPGFFKETSSSFEETGMAPFEMPPFPSYNEALPSSPDKQSLFCQTERAHDKNARREVQHRRECWQSAIRPETPVTKALRPGPDSSVKIKTRQPAGFFKAG